MSSKPRSLMIPTTSIWRSAAASLSRLTGLGITFTRTRSIGLRTSRPAKLYSSAHKTNDRYPPVADILWMIEFRLSELNRDIAYFGQCGLRRSFRDARPSFIVGKPLITCAVLLDRSLSFEASLFDNRTGRRFRACTRPIGLPWRWPPRIPATTQQSSLGNPILKQSSRLRPLLNSPPQPRPQNPARINGP